MLKFLCLILMLCFDFFCWNMVARIFVSAFDDEAIYSNGTLCTCEVSSLIEDGLSNNYYIDYENLSKHQQARLRDAIDTMTVTIDRGAAITIRSMRFAYFLFIISICWLCISCIMAANRDISRVATLWVYIVISLLELPKTIIDYKKAKQEKIQAQLQEKFKHVANRFYRFDKRY